ELTQALWLVELGEEQEQYLLLLKLRPHLLLRLQPHSKKDPDLLWALGHLPLVEELVELLQQLNKLEEKLTELLVTVDNASRMEALSLSSSGNGNGNGASGSGNGDETVSVGRGSLLGGLPRSGFRTGEITSMKPLSIQKKQGK
ncbi:unnamed protein product, partial [Cyprideis torosa]